MQCVPSGRGGPIHTIAVRIFCEVICAVSSRSPGTFEKNHYFWPQGFFQMSRSFVRENYEIFGDASLIARIRGKTAIKWIEKGVINASY